MLCSNSVIDELLKEREATIPTRQDKKYRIVYSRPGGFFDVVISHDREPIGFITLKYLGEGTYSIVNDTKRPGPLFRRDQADVALTATRYFCMKFWNSLIELTPGNSCSNSFRLRESRRKEFLND